MRHLTAAVDAAAAAAYFTPGGAAQNQVSRLSIQRAVLLWIVSGHWTHTLLLFRAAATTGYDNFVQLQSGYGLLGMQKKTGNPPVFKPVNPGL